AVTFTYSLDFQPYQQVPLVGNQYYSFLHTLSSGRHTITLKAIDANGCIGTLTKTLKIADVTPCPMTMPSTTNKTVACGSVWSFDPPLAFTYCCGTNVTVANLSTVTNGSCPQLIARTWSVTDCCSN